MSIESIVSRRAVRKDKLRELMKRTREQLLALSVDKPQGTKPSEQPEHAPDSTKAEVREQVVRGLSEEAPDGGLGKAQISAGQDESTTGPVKPAKRKRSPAKSTQRAGVK